MINGTHIQTHSSKVFSFISNKKLYYLLIITMLIERLFVFINYSIKYTDSDQVLQWLISKDLSEGKFYGLCFYGQKYNPIFEPLLTLPFLKMGLPFAIVHPFVVTCISLTPVFLLSHYFKKQYSNELSILPLVFTMTLPLEYDMLTSLSRGFSGSVFFTICTLYFLSDTYKFYRLIISGICMGIGVFINPNTLLFIPIFIYVFFDQKQYNNRRIIDFILGLLITTPLFIYNYWFYYKHPEFLVNKQNPEIGINIDSFLKVITQLDNYFEFVTPFLWKLSWMSLLLLFGLFFVFYKRKQNRLAFLFGFCFMTILLSFFIPKVSDATNSVYFSGSRLYLFYPMMLIFLIAIAAHHLKWGMKFYSVLIVLSFISVFVKIFAFHPLLSHALRPSAYSLVKVIKVEELNQKCKEISVQLKKNKSLVLANSPGTADQVITYGCPCLLDSFPSTIQPAYDRRFWEKENISKQIYSSIYLFGSDSNLTNKVINDSFFQVESFKINQYVIFNNSQKTKDLTQHLGIEWR